MRRITALTALWLCSIIFGIADTAFIKVPSTTFTGYIVQKEFAGEQLQGINADMGGKWLDKDGRWTPSSDNAIHAEKAVQKFLNRSTTELHLAFPEIVAHPEKFAPGAIEGCKKQLAGINLHYGQYGIQFAGIKVHGRRKILCNFFYLPDPIYVDPSARFVVVNDGGYYFWHIEYDVSMDTCSNIQINGGE